MTVTKEQALKALDRMQSLYPHAKPDATLRQFIEQSQDSGHAPAPTDDAERLCWALRQFVSMHPAGDECRVRFDVGSQSFWIGIESLPEEDAAYFAGQFVLALTGAFRALAAPAPAPQQPVAYTKLAEYEVMAGCYHLSEPAAQWTRKLPEGKYVICATPTEAVQGKENQQ